MSAQGCPWQLCYCGGGEHPQARPLAQMGPSGSGKTTLLDVLAGRKASGRTEGSVLFSNVKASSMFLRRYTGYVEQCGAPADAMAVKRGGLCARTMHPSLTHHAVLLSGPVHK